MLVSVDKSSGRVMALSSDGFSAVKESGVWRPGVFSADDLKDNFERVLDPKLAKSLFQEAQASLSDFSDDSK